MIPRLYAAGTTSFTTEGLGALADTMSCVATTAVNGVPSLSMEYPIAGVHAAEIGERCIIVADRDRTRKAQPYMIKTVDKNTPGIMKIYAEHLAVCLLDGIGLEPYTASGITNAIAGLSTHATDPLPVTVSTQLSSSAAFNHAAPSTVKRALGGMEGSLLDTYGGEWDFNTLQAVLMPRTGTDNGVIIRWGKNLTELKVSIDWSGVYTGIYPFWRGQDGTVAQMTPPVYSLGTFDFTRVLMLDLSSEYQQQPAAADLLASAQAYAQTHNLTSPTFSWSVGFVELRGAAEYKDVALLEDVSLGDTVRIYLPDYGVNATARVVKETFDVLLGQFQKLEIGNVKANLATAITSQGAAAVAAVRAEASGLYNAIQEATEAITGNKGGYIVTVLNADGQPQELLIMDTPDITTATNVWRWNVSGLGFSSNGYAGPYATAITADGKIVADFITAGTLDASLINVINLVAHQLQATNGTNQLNINGYSLNIKDGADYRAWLPTTGNQQGSLFLYGGSRPNAAGAYNDQGTDATSFQSYINATGMMLGQDYQGKVTGTLSAKRVNLSNDGALYIYDGNGNVITRVTAANIGLNSGDIYSSVGNVIAYNGSFFAQDGTRTRAVMRGQSGNIQMYGSNGQERIGLYPAEPQIAMYNASGSRIGRWRPDLNYEGSVSANTAFTFTLEDGEAAMIMYTAASNVGDVDIKLLVNSSEADYSSYSYAGSSNNYVEKMIARSSYGTFVGWIACHNGIVEVYGSGRRGTSNVRGDVMLVFNQSSVSSLAFSAAGTVKVTHIAM